jgi:hypothetical protein
MEPHGCERHRWVKPGGRNKRERVSQSGLWRIRNQTVRQNSSIQAASEAANVPDMAVNQIEVAAATRAPHRFRYLIDIVALVAVTFLLDAVVGAFVQVSVNMRTGFVFDAIGKLFLIAIGWGLIRLRGERLADVGLKRPKSWWQTFLIGIVYAAVVFAAIYFSEKAGFRRDLSRFKDVQGNLNLTIYGVCYAFIGAGLYEEFMFRGFLMQGLACVLARVAAHGWRPASFKARFSARRTRIKIRLASRSPEPLESRWALSFSSPAAISGW